MKLLDKINSQFVVAIDIETVRIEKEYKNLLDGYKDAWANKNKFEGAVQPEAELANIWKESSSLYAEFSKVCAVSICFLKGKELMSKTFYGDDEKNILEELASMLNRIYNKSTSYRLIGHAAKYFDYPFLAKRYIINEMDIPVIIDSSNLKPWEHSNLCSNEIWRSCGIGPGSSLQALCNVLDVPTSKVDMVGDEVGESYYKKEYKEIGEYCRKDTIATFNVFRKFKKESIFQFNEVKEI